MFITNMYCSSEDIPEAVLPEEWVPGILSDGKDSSDVSVMFQYNTVQLEFNTPIEKYFYKDEIISDTECYPQSLIVKKSKTCLHTIK